MMATKSCPRAFFIILSTALMVGCGSNTQTSVGPSNQTATSTQSDLPIQPESEQVQALVKQVAASGEATRVRDLEGKVVVVDVRQVDANILDPVEFEATVIFAPANLIGLWLVVVNDQLQLLYVGPTTAVTIDAANFLDLVTITGVTLTPTFVLATSVAPPSIDQFYVAPNGNDATGNGSSANPWATITQALDSVPDGSTILVRPGLYMGRVRLRGRFAQGVTVRSEIPYQAQFRHNATVFTAFDTQGITLEGFDIAHTGPGAGGLVIQIQTSDPANPTREITLRNNIIHDSFNNDLLKINNGATDILVQGNVFYNQTGSDEHIDINSVEDVIVEDNIFFNDFEGSGRSNTNSTSSFVVIKDSNAGADAFLGSDRITVRRNIFLNWQGNTGANFVLVGEDGQPFYEARNVLIENNLLLGNSSNTLRAAFGVKGSRDITFRNNTIVGNLPSLAFAFRLNAEGSNLPNDNVQLHNNIWSDPTGTMDDFSDTPLSETNTFSLDTNLYWNGGNPIPTNLAGDLVNVTNDPAAIIANPGLPNPTTVSLPRWIPATNQFADGSITIRQAFEALVEQYGRLPFNSPANGVANPNQSAGEDILGRSRGGSPDIGAYEQ